MKKGIEIYNEINKLDEEIIVYGKALERLRVNDLNELVPDNVAIHVLRKELKIARDKRNRLANADYIEEVAE